MKKCQKWGKKLPRRLKNFSNWLDVFILLLANLTKICQILKKVKRPKLPDVQEIAWEVTNTAEMIDVVVNGEKG